MKFYNTLFPIMKVWTPTKDIAFVDGVYDTEDAYEIKVLKDAGFAYDEPSVPVEKKKPATKKE